MHMPCMVPGEFAGIITWPLYAQEDDTMSCAEAMLLYFTMNSYD